MWTKAQNIEVYGSLFLKPTSKWFRWRTTTVSFLLFKGHDKGGLFLLDTSPPSHLPSESSAVPPPTLRNDLYAPRVLLQSYQIIRYSYRFDTQHRFILPPTEFLFPVHPWPLRRVSEDPMTCLFTFFPGIFLGFGFRFWGTHRDSGGIHQALPPS